MNRPDYKLYELDLTAKSTFNAINGEYGKRNGGEFENLVIPINAPFYQESVKMYHPDGSPMIFGEDYEFYGIMADLTAYTAHDVGLFIKLNKPEITEYIIDYQIVGNYSILTREILNMLRTVAQDDRPVEWGNIDNKPLWYDPELHQHDYTYDFFLFGDLAKQIKRVQSFSGSFNSGVQTQLDTFLIRVDAYIAQYTSVIKSLLDTHDASKVDPHGVWKTHIGLGNVDNFMTATLQEVIEGTRDDLHMRPADAVKAVELVAADNQRLYPSGNLPLLRYGTDSYIPPKIDGSFEGMGGYNLRGCAVLEGNGSATLLQYRNDGRTRGLYFITCLDPYAKKPEWNFTSYRYTHPTAVADGALLDTVINGSGEHVMVLGDAQKGIWYWTETNGTLNPEKHVLYRLEGDVAKAITGDGTKCTLLVDEDYKNQWFILAGATHATVTSVRPNYPTVAQLGGGDHSVEGHQLFSCRNRSRELNVCTIDFVEQDGARPIDTILMLYTRVIQTTPSFAITSFICDYTIPCSTAWSYRGVNGEIKQTSNPGEYAIRIMTHHYLMSAIDGRPFGHTPVWKGTMTFNSATNVLTFKRGPGERRYKFAPTFAPDPTAENELYDDWKQDPQSISSDQNLGLVRLGGNGTQLAIVAGVAGSLPCIIRILEPKGTPSPENFIGPNSKYKLELRDSRFLPEMNPGGLSVGFSDAFAILGNTDDPSTGMIISRQLEASDTALIPTLVARKMPFMRADWQGNTDNLTNVTLNGVSLRTYPFTTEIYGCDTGINMCWSSHGFTGGGLPVGHPTLRERWTRFAGADGSSNISGKIVGTNGVVADFYFPRISRTKIVGGKIVIEPVEVYNLQKFIMGPIKTYLDNLGIFTGNINVAWTACTVYSRTGEEYVALMVTDRSPGTGARPVAASIFVGKLKGVGTPTTDKGYTFYNDATIDFGTRYFRTGTLLGTAIANAVPSTSNGGYKSGLSISEHNIGTRAGTDKETLLYIRSLHKYPISGDTLPISLAIELDADMNILRAAGVLNSSSPYGTGVTSMPGVTIGYTFPGDDGLIRGTGIVGTILGGGNSKFDALVTGPSKGATKYLVMSNLLPSAFTVYFKEIDNLLIAGKKYSMEGSYQDLRDIDPNPANKTFYIYLKYWMGGPAHVIETSLLPETAVCGLVAIVKCGPSQIDTITPYNRFTMDGIQISASRQGSSIIGARGSIHNVGNASNILLDTDFLPE